MAASPQTARQCGGCTLCCKVIEVEELRKPGGAWCPHCTPGRGCGIYDSRPEECRAFSCGWLLDTAMPDNWRPDRSKLVFHPQEGTRDIVVHVDPGTPDAWRREPYNSWLRNKAAVGLDTGASVLVSVGGNATLVLPENEQFLGHMHTGDEIKLSKTIGPEGAMLEVKVIRHTPVDEEGS